MPAPSDFAAFLGPLETLGLPYCVTGSVAAGIYGEPRTTLDIDFVLLLKMPDVAKFRAAFSSEDFYVPPLEVLLSETVRGTRGMFNLIHQPSMLKADVYVAVRDPLHLWALEKRRRSRMPDGTEVWVAPPEYVILRKLEYYREGGHEKHLRDVAFMLVVTDLDQAFIEEHIVRLGLRQQWEAGRKYA